MRLLADASSLIALARIGELDLLKELAGEVHVTPEVLGEVLHPDHPEGEAARAATQAGWLRVTPGSAGAGRLRAFGLDPGEASLFLAALPGDVLLVDDLPTRRLAEARGQPHTGLLGMLVSAVEEGTLDAARGLAVLDKLAAGTFYMSVDLYREARDRMEHASSKR